MMMFSLCMMCTRRLKRIEADAQIERSEGEARSEEFALKCGGICVDINCGRADSAVCTLVLCMFCEDSTVRYNLRGVISKPV